MREAGNERVEDDFLFDDSVLGSFRLVAGLDGIERVEDDF